MLLQVLPDIKEGVGVVGSGTLGLSAFMDLVIHFVFNLIICFIIVRFLYYPKTRRKDFLFTYLIFNSVIFLLCYLLENVKLQLGFALGLFAVFGIIRYRTLPVPIKEMTYLFVVICLAVINSLSNAMVGYPELLFSNFAVLAIIYAVERIWLLKHEAAKEIIYENLELIRPENRKKLIEDLEKRTGIKINRVEIGKINFLRDTAKLRIHFFAMDPNGDADDYSVDIDDD